MCTPDLDGTERPCVRENEHGKCFGYEHCEGAGGWSPCSADEPAPESCDGLDNDCDGAVDEDQPPRTCERSNDFGVCVGAELCQGDEGWICEAAEPEDERCDDLDNDCDGVIDDGYVNATDCADYNAAVHHGATEVCNGVDDDCDNDVDEGETEAPAGTVYYRDNDSDTYADTSDGRRYCQETGKYTVAPAGQHDCCDTDDNARPGQATYFTAERLCGGFDYNCDSAETAHWPAAGACACNNWFWGFCIGCGSASGWNGAVPACGDDGDYITACTYNIGSCGATQESRIQECR